jgi:hypothetical protein
VVKLLGPLVAERQSVRWLTILWTWICQSTRTERRGMRPGEIDRCGDWSNQFKSMFRQLRTTTGATSPESTLLSIRRSSKVPAGEKMIFVRCAAAPQPAKALDSLCPFIRTSQKVFHRVSAHGRMNCVLFRVKKFLVRRRFPGNVASEQSLAADGAIACFSSNFISSGWMVIARRS